MSTPLQISKAPRLGELRERAGLTRVQLAERSGVHYGQLWRIEAGERGCTADTLRKLADALAPGLKTSPGVVMEELTNPHE